MQNISFRKELTKLRIRNHILLIEKGRYYTPKIPREERFCPVCSTNSVESESHFLFDCAFYNEERKDLYSKLAKFLETDVTTINIDSTLQVIMNNHSSRMHVFVAEYVFKCMNKIKDF